MLIRCGPHQTNIGNRELRQMPTATRRLCGHCSGTPSGVLAQSKARTLSAISPRPLMVGFPDLFCSRFSGVSKRESVTFCSPTNGTMRILSNRHAIVVFEDSSYARCQMRFTYITHRRAPRTFHLYTSYA